MASGRRALIIASDTYEDPELRGLRAPGHDAAALAAVLSDPNVGGFDVRVSLNEPNAHVRIALNELFLDQGLEDVLLLHFSCHGIKDDLGEARS